MRDAHGLYVETLAELGPLGLGLLLVALGVPLWRSGARSWTRRRGSIGRVRRLRRPRRVDWDWELSAVTLAGLLCGALLVMAARRRGEREA